MIFSQSRSGFILTYEGIKKKKKKIRPNRKYLAQHSVERVFRKYNIDCLGQITFT